MTLLPLPTQPTNQSWPTDTWPLRQPDVADLGALDTAVAELFDAGRPELGRTDALVVVQAGAIVAERYGAEVSAESTLPSWSMAKSMTAVLGAIAGVDWSGTVDAPEWVDERSVITAGHLLTMTSGLEWSEIYEVDQPSDVVTMLFGDARADAAHYAADKPLTSAPGSTYQYSSGTSNVLARHIATKLGLGHNSAGFEHYMRTKLFEPIGMNSPAPRFDDAGTFIGSSFCDCTARDFARFGLLCLRDGVWEGDRIIPEGAIDRFRTATEVSRGIDDFVHGAHFWVHEDGLGTFACHGFEGQYIWMVPAADLVLVRSGVRPEQDKATLVEALRDIVREFAR
ncbi:MAG: serine hydrolase [Actinomycetia bacterium]|nr:serine hydrolase [Actinomycetes bacterium]MCP4960708.1 serine hydrolase [Actinomycetes bacterium]